MKVLIALCLVALAYANPIEERLDLKTLDDLLLANNSSYIVSGQRAAKCEFPSIVSLSIIKNGRGFMCGGTLLDATHVITAAHCVASGVQRVTINMGSLYARYPKFVDIASNVQAHESFYVTAKALHNDVAMLTLYKPVPFADCMQPIALASPGESFEGQTCVTAGWGKTGWTMPVSEVLRKVQLPIMPYQECHRIWPHIGHEHICAGTWMRGGPTPCQGDSGGPLYCKSKAQWVLAGLVSFGLKCEFGPALYTNVAYFRNWIDSHRL
uniref:Serine protease 1 n=1 Tax=Heterololigo bleekeri TaxID=1423826 RepID=D2KX87_HETBL|nr:serine protease 1 [Heterololigo bleekeri]